MAEERGSLRGSEAFVPEEWIPRLPTGSSHFLPLFYAHLPIKQEMSCKPFPFGEQALVPPDVPELCFLILTKQKAKH